MVRSEINKIESIAISRNLLPIFIMGASGLVFGYLANSNAIMLDGAFSTVILLTVILAKKINRLANTPRTHNYPRGRFLLENIYILFKIVVLITILVISMGDAFISLFEYFVFGIKPEEINQFYANIYYALKLLSFGVAYAIYSHYYNLTDKSSSILKLERKAVLIDGTITISIFLGFQILSYIPLLRDVSDSIILFGIASFLLYEIIKDFKEQLNKTLGKRDLVQRELYYRSYFNLYLAGYEILDVYIFYLGKLCTVSIVANFVGERCVEDLCLLEKDIKDIMREEFDDIYLYLYWDSKHIDYNKDQKRISENKKIKHHH